MSKRRTLLCIIAILFGASITKKSFGSYLSAECVRQMDRLGTIISKNKFATDRNFDSYAAIQAEDFEVDIHMLAAGLKSEALDGAAIPANHTDWVDYGSGESVAMRPIDWERDPPSFQPDLHELTLVGVSRTFKDQQKIYAAFGQTGPTDHFKLFEKDVTEMKPGEFHPALIGSDTYGPGTYEFKKFARIIEVYGENLVPGGKQYLNIPLTGLHLVDVNGRTIPPEVWFRNIKGMKLLSAERAFDINGSELKVCLQRTGDKIVSPHTKANDLIAYGIEGVPWRSYHVSGLTAPANAPHYDVGDLQQLVTRAPEYLLDAHSFKRILSDSTPEFRAQLLYHLAKPKALQALAELQFKRDPKNASIVGDSQIRAAAETKIREMKPWLATIIADQLSDPDPTVKWLACDAIERLVINTPHAISKLRELANQESIPADVRLHAIDQLMTADPSWPIPPNLGPVMAEAFPKAKFKNKSLTHMLHVLGHYAKTAPSSLAREEICEIFVQLLSNRHVTFETADLLNSLDFRQFSDGERRAVANAAIQGLEEYSRREGLGPGDDDEDILHWRKIADHAP
jgi:hypothetical protein